MPTHTGCQPESLVVMSCFRWLLDIIPRSLPFLPHPLSARAQLRLPPDRPLDHPQSRLVTLNTARNPAETQCCGFLLVTVPETNQYEKHKAGNRKDGQRKQDTANHSCHCATLTNQR